MDNLQKQAEEAAEKWANDLVWQNKFLDIEREVAYRDGFIAGSGYSTSHAEVERLREALGKLRREVIEALNGIDKDNTDVDEGYWETSTGVEYGTRVLQRINNAFDAALSPNK